MAGGRASPTATLLRNSRLFSLPSPIPRPSQALKGTAVFESPTATTLYPTHAAIQTTQSSLPRGDWGLKQALPSKIIGKTPNSTIRIGDIETIDHITEFEPATDLTMTLMKFQEFGLPVTMPQRSSPKASSPTALAPSMSVFESHVDNIQTEEGNITADRWKFKGPWLAVETERGFQEYIRKTVSGQKTAFRKLLREELARRELTARHEGARNEGRDVSQDPIEILDQQVDDYVRHLRSNPKEMRTIIEGFLDLPRAITFSNAHEGSSESRTNHAIAGPPKTHPSAGLTYLRTVSRIHNDPLLGPQELKEPIQGRFLVSHTTARGKKRSRALIGIGGVVAEDNYTRHQIGRNSGTSSKGDSNIAVGSKYWFHPERASVSNSGRIMLQLRRATVASLILFTGVDDEMPNLTDEPAVPNVPGGFPTQSSNWPQVSLRATQGYGIENENEPSSRNSNRRVQPLDSKEAHATAAMLDLGRFDNR